MKLRLLQIPRLRLFLVTCLAANRIYPPAPETPPDSRNEVFGMLPNSPLPHAIPATGDQPKTFKTDQLSHDPNNPNLGPLHWTDLRSFTAPGTLQVPFSAGDQLDEPGWSHRVVRRRPAIVCTSAFIVVEGCAAWGLSVGFPLPR